MLWGALGGSGELWEALGSSGRLWEALGGFGALGGVFVIVIIDVFEKVAFLLW